MNILEVNQKIKNLVDDFADKEWTRYSNEAGYSYREEKYSFVILEDNEIIGYIALSINSGAAYLSKLLVKKEFRNKGVGNILINKFEDIAKENKCHVAYLETSEKNKEALEFYKKRGYKIVAELKKNKSRIDWYILEKVLK